ncbi:MAG: hypothetical protein RI894_1326 [Bacteroidota bacterium]|jgi:DNA-binding transcriptional MerR regulator
MKKILFAATVALFSTIAAFAQNVVVTEGTASMSQGSNNAFTVKLPGTDRKDVEKAWKNFIDNYKGKLKTDKKTDETLANNSIIKEINGDNTIDVYSKITADSKTDNTLTVWFNLGGAYLSSQAHGDKAKIAQKMIADFALSVSRTMLEEQLKDEEKKAKKEAEKLKDLEKDKAELEKDIESYKKKIAKAEDDIKKNVEKQKDQTAALEKQKEAVEEVKKKISSLK